MDSLFYIVNVEAAIFHEEKWLIVKRSESEGHAGGTFALVGGKVETSQIANDVLESTLKREILEEVDIEIYDDIRYVKSSFFVTQDGQPVIDIVFLCRYKSGIAKVVDQKELSSVKWMNTDAILNNKTVPPWTKESIEKADRLRLLS